jgi:DNA-directed RNA polymerase subunit RPC12/RpoP
VIDDELRMDGNAAAGTLGEAFSFEVTTAEYACGGCGRAGRLGEAMVYEVRQLGTIVRCPSCDKALIRLAYNRGRYLIDLRGAKYLATG